MPGRRAAWNSMVSGCCAVRAIGTSASTCSIPMDGRNSGLPTHIVSSGANENTAHAVTHAATWTRRKAWSNTYPSRSRSSRATRCVSEGSSELGSVYTSSTKRSIVWNANVK